MIPQEEWECFKGMLAEVKNAISDKQQHVVNSEWLDTGEACKVLGVSAKTMQSYRDRRLFPFSQFGRKIYVRRSDLDSFIQQHMITARQ